jgi:hypothetical protein
MLAARHTGLSPRWHIGGLRVHNIQVTLQGTREDLAVDAPTTRWAAATAGTCTGSRGRKQ